MDQWRAVVVYHEDFSVGQWDRLCLPTSSPSGIGLELDRARSRSLSERRDVRSGRRAHLAHGQGIALGLDGGELHFEARELLLQ